MDRPYVTLLLGDGASDGRSMLRREIGLLNSLGQSIASIPDLESQAEAIGRVAGLLERWLLVRARAASSAASADTIGPMIAAQTRLFHTTARSTLAIRPELLRFRTVLAELDTDPDSGVWTDAEAVAALSRDAARRAVVLSSLVEVNGAQAEAYRDELAVVAAAFAKTAAKAYRRAALRYHPDRMAGADAAAVAEAEVMFARLGRAFDVLGDTDRRRAYLAADSHDAYVAAVADAVDRDDEQQFAAARRRTRAPQETLAIVAATPPRLRTPRLVIGAPGIAVHVASVSEATRNLDPALWYEIFVVAPGRDPVLVLTSRIGGEVELAWDAGGGVVCGSDGIHGVCVRAVNGFGPGPRSLPAEYVVETAGDPGSVSTFSAADVARMQRAAVEAARTEERARARARAKAKRARRAAAAAAAPVRSVREERVVRATGRLFRAARKHSVAQMEDAIGKVPPCDVAAVVNGSNRDGNAVLVVATMDANEDVAMWLIDTYANAGLNMNASDAKHGRCVLSWAISVGAYDVVDAVLAQGRRRIDIDAADFDGWTPLHFAVQSADVRVIERIVRLRADVNAASYEAPALTPLHVAVCSGSVELVALLVAAGAALVAPQSNLAAALCEPIDWLAFDPRGCDDVSPIGLAVGTTDAELVRTVWAMVGDEAERALAVAELFWYGAASGQYELVDELVPGWADERDSEDNTLLHVVYAYGGGSDDAGILAELGGKGVVDALAEAENSDGLVPAGVANAFAVDQFVAAMDGDGSDGSVSGDSACATDSEGDSDADADTDTDADTESSDEDRAAGTLDLVPLEVLIDRVFTLLNVGDLLALGQTCRVLRVLVRDNMVWRRLFVATFPGVPAGGGRGAWKDGAWLAKFKGHVRGRRWCRSCGTIANLFVCAGCKSATYCSPKCQSSDWGRHRLQCVAVVAARRRRRWKGEVRRRAVERWAAAEELATE